MRINKYVAQATGFSRRAADQLIAKHKVLVNGKPPEAGQAVSDTDVVTLDGQALQPSPHYTTILLNKPVGYVCSRDGQGSPTIYDLLPVKYTRLKPVGRLDKDSSGLILLTDDGQLAHQLTHPSFQKTKAYQVTLRRPLESADQQAIERGIELEDGLSQLQLSGQGQDWTITMKEGRNRQIRRTFEAVGNQVIRLNRSAFGEHTIGSLGNGDYREV